MGIDYNPSKYLDNSILYLDAKNTKSYRGSDIYWNNLIPTSSVINNIVFFAQMENSSYIDSTGRHTLAGTSGVTITSNPEGGFAAAVESGSAFGYAGLRYNISGNVNDFVFTSDFDIEWDMRLTATSASQQLVCQHLGGVSVDWLIEFNGSYLHFYRGGTVLIESGAAMTTGVTYKCALRRRGSLLQFYRNGVVTGSTTYASTFGSTTTALGVGGTSNTYAYGMHGWIDNVKITNGQSNIPNIIGSLNYSSDGYFAFDGSTTYCVTSDTTNYNNFTLSAWIRPQSSTGDKHLINKNSYFAAATTDFPVALRTSGTSVIASVSSGTSYSITTPSDGAIISVSNAMELDKWVSLTMTYDQNQLRLYINDTLYTVPCTVTPSTNSQKWTIGRAAQELSGGIGTTYFKGHIAQVSIYNAALSVEQVKKNFNAMRGRFGV